MDREVLTSEEWSVRVSERRKERKEKGEEIIRLEYFCGAGWRIEKEDEKDEKRKEDEEKSRDESETWKIMRK